MGDSAAHHKVEKVALELPTPGGLLKPGMRAMLPLRMPLWKRILLFGSVLMIAAGVAALIVLRDNLKRFSHKKEVRIGWIPPYKPLSEVYPPACDGSFGNDFKWGFSISAWQNEGYTAADGKGKTIWDSWYITGGISKSFGDPNKAASFYTKYESDIQLMNNMNVQSFRLSLSWARILPDGKAGTAVNPAGIDYYNKVIDKLLEFNITPVVTLFHFDLPAALEPGMDDKKLETAGFLSADIIEHFAYYAEVAFAAFGDRVKNWITFNEPANFCEFGYEFGWWPPGFKGHDSQVCKKNCILAHAEVYQRYHKKWDSSSTGKVGIVHSVFWAQPYRENNADDLEASNIRMESALGWWLDPVFAGQYLNQTWYVKKLSANEVTQVHNTLDFVGVNYYTARWYSWDNKNKTKIVDRAADANNLLIGEQLDPDWVFNCPWGLQLTLKYMKNRYKDDMKPVWITESGLASESTTDNKLDDTRRVQFYKDHLQYLCKAIKEDGVKVDSFLAWTLTDNYEWGYGITKRFGVFRIDYDQPDLPRVKKASANWLELFFRQAL